MAIRKMVLQVSFLYDDETHAPREWSLAAVADQIEGDGECIGLVETLSDSDPLSDDEVRAWEIDWGGDGTFMLAGKED